MELVYHVHLNFQGCCFYMNIWCQVIWGTLQ